MTDDNPRYVVGRGRPPQQNRFKKGQSGNPSGRPKGRYSFKSILDKRAFEQIALKGSKEKRPAIDVLVTQLRNKAMKGDAKAAALFLQVMRAHHLPDVPEIENTESDWTENDKALLSDFFRRNAVVKKDGDDDKS